MSLGLIACLFGSSALVSRAQNQIIDPPIPTQVVVSITAADPEAAEPNPLVMDPASGLPIRINTAVFTVGRRGPIDFDLPVFYRLQGTAENGIDYDKLSGQVMIPKGESTVNVVIYPKPDLLKEGTETVGIVLESPACIEIFPSPRECYLVGLASAARAVILDSPVVSDNLPPRVGIVKPTTGQVFDDPARILVQADAVDADGYADFVEFYAGSVKVGESRLTFVKAPEPGSVLTHSFEWVNPPVGAHELVGVAHDDRGAISRSVAVPVRVVSVSPPERPEVSVVTTDAEAVEPPLFPDITASAPRPNIAVFTLTRKGSIEIDLPVNYRLEGNAVNGEDYAKLPGRIVIPKGQDAVRVAIVPLADRLKEGTETVALVIEEPICVQIFPPPLECYLVGVASSAKAILIDTPPPVGNLPPRVVVTAPLPGAVFRMPTMITLSADVVDADGYAPRAEFFLDGLKVGDSSLVFIQAPKPGTVLKHSFEWKTPTAGAHELVVVAYDDGGAASKSQPTQFRVIDEPKLPVVTVLAIDGEAAEMRTPLPWERLAPNKGQFKVSRTGSVEAPLTVFYVTLGTAINGLDYEALPGKVEIAAGASSALIEVFGINDQIVEPTESIILSLDRSVLALPLDTAGHFLPPILTYDIGVPSSAKVILLDNGEGLPPEVPVVNVTATDPEASEPLTGDPNSKVRVDDGRFSITRTGKTDLPLEVYFRIGGTAANGVDYGSVPWIATIPAGAESVDVSIVPLFDRLVEGDESVVLSLVRLFPLPPIISDPPIVLNGADTEPVTARGSYLIGEKAGAKLVIHDRTSVENSPPKVAIVKPLPGASSLAPATFLIEVQTADADGYVPWVEFFASGKKIGDSRLDFLVAPKPGTLVTHTFEWGGVDSGEYELTAMAHDDGGAVTTTAPAVVVRVKPNSQKTLVSVKASDAEGAESDPVAPGMGRPTLLNPIVFEIRRLGDLTVPIRVSYRLEGSARNGMDYDFLSGVVEIPKEADSVNVVVTPIDDDLVEGVETVVLVIDPPICLAVVRPAPWCYGIAEGAGAAKALILDNDPNDSLRPTVTLSASDALATEGESDWTSPTATFVVTRHGPVSEELVVGLRLGGTAVSGKDYVGLPDKVVIPAGKTEVNLTLKAIDDESIEQIETVLVELLPAEAPGRIEQLGWPIYRLGQPSKAVAVILDNDQTRPGCKTLPDGHFHVCLPGADGVRYVLQVSTDLKEWRNRGTADAAEGVVHYVDPEIERKGVLFYRSIPETLLGAP